MSRPWLVGAPLADPRNCPVDAASMAAVRSSQQRDKRASAAAMVAAWSGQERASGQAAGSRRGQCGPGEACGRLDLLEQRMRGKGNDSKRRMRWDVKGGGAASER